MRATSPWSRAAKKASRGFKTCSMAGCDGAGAATAERTSRLSRLSSLRSTRLRESAMLSNDALVVRLMPASIKPSTACWIARWVSRVERGFWKLPS